MNRVLVALSIAILCSGCTDQAASETDGSTFSIPSSPEEQYQLGISYVRGEGQERDFGRASALFRKAAEAGHIGARYELGLNYANGRGTPVDHTRSVAEFKRAADLGHAQAMAALGTALLHGKGAPKDEAAALSLLQQAADKGDPYAVWRLGVQRLTSGSPADAEALFARAGASMETAARDGYVLAQLALGWMHQQGQGGLGNDHQAANAWFERAANQGSAAAARELGEAYLLGYGVQRDPSIAVDWFRLASQRGDTEAMGELGRMLAMGHGVAPDPASAAPLLQQAASDEKWLAYAPLALLYINGTGLPQDFMEGARWAEKGVAGGDQFAAVLLGRLYLEGLGVEKDEAKALRLFQSSESKWPMAKAYIGLMFQEGRGGLRKDLKRAITIFREAADRGDTMGQYYLARALETGSGVARDEVAAAALYARAAPAYGPAQERLDYLRRPHVGAPFRAGPFEITVTEARATGGVGGFLFNSQPAEGARYVVAAITYRNVSNAPVDSDEAPRIFLVDPRGQTYTPDVEGSTAYAYSKNTTNKLLSDINPDISLTDADAFEVSERLLQQKGWKLKIRAGGADTLLDIDTGT